MSKICNDVSETEQLRFWVSELTTFTPKQVDSVIELLRSKEIHQSESVAS
jgi:hypothetical protein